MADTSQRSHVDTPALEMLENRLLLSATPQFATPLGDLYALPVFDAGGLTLGIDGYDADGDPLTVTAELLDGSDDVSIFIPQGNRYAKLTFVDHNGEAMGDVLVQLFEGRQPAAAERFITLATNAVAADGTLDPDGTPFYTDVNVHRVISNFMVQTGDAENGNGTGGSPLNDLDDEFDDVLNFAGLGVLAMANSGADTSNAQFFITEGPYDAAGSKPGAMPKTANDKYMIFGQVISGQNVVDALAHLKTDNNDKPANMPLLQSVEILDSPQDGTITIAAGEDFDGEAALRITLTDTEGRSVEQIISLVDAPNTGNYRPSITLSKQTEKIQPGKSVVVTATIVDYDKYSQEPRIEALCDAPGVDVDVSLDAGGSHKYNIEVSVPANFDGADFPVRILAWDPDLGDYANLPPTEEVLTITTVGNRPSITNPGVVQLDDEGPTVLTLTISDDYGAPIDVAASADDPAVEVSIAPTDQANKYELTINAPQDYAGAFKVTVTAVESDYPDLEPAERTFTVTTLGARPVISSIEDMAVTPDVTAEVAFTVTDDGDVPLSVTAVCSDDDVDVAVTDEGDGAYTLSMTVPANYHGRFKITVNAIEAGYEDYLTASVRTFYISTLGEQPTIEEIGTQLADEGATLVVPIMITDDSGLDLDVTISDNDSDATVSIEAGETPQDPHIATIEVPEDYKGTFTVTVNAVEDAEGTPLKTTYAFKVTTLGERPVIGQPGEVLFVPGGTTHAFDAEITDDSDMELEVEIDSDMNSDDVKYADIEAIRDPATDEVISYQITIDTTRLPEGFSSFFRVTVTAIEKDAEGDTDETTKTFVVTTVPDYEPPVLDYLDAGNSAETTLVMGDRLYVGTSKELVIYDISDPTAPEKLGSHGVKYKITDIIVDGDTAFLGIYGNYYAQWNMVLGGGQVLALDISDPADISARDTLTTEHVVTDMELVDDTLFIANWSEGVLACDVSDLDSLEVIGTFKNDDRDRPLVDVADTLARHGDRLYVTDPTAKTLILDVSDPTEIAQVGQVKTNIYDIAGQPSDVAVEGDVLYVMDYNTGLWRYDLTDPTNPKRDGWLGWRGSDVAVSGNVVVITYGGYHLFVDAADPKQMTTSHRIFAPGYAQGGCFDGNLVALPSQSQGLMLVDTQILQDSITIGTQRTITYDDGSKVTVSISGGGRIRLTPGDLDDGHIEKIEVLSPVNSTRVSVRTRGGEFTLGDINVYDNINTFAADVTLLGSAVFEGSLKNLKLGDVGHGDNRIEQLIRIDGDEDNDRAQASIQLGQVWDLSIDSAMPLRQVKADQWNDDESDIVDQSNERDEIHAPSLGTLVIGGGRDLAGDFLADLRLNDDGASDDSRILGSARIAGQVAQSQWTIHGDSGAIQADSTASTFLLVNYGEVGKLKTTDELGGDLTADAFGNVQTNGLFSATLTADDMDGKGVSLGQLKADVIADTTISLAGGLNMMKIGQWSAGQLQANSLNRLVTRANRRTGATGDFGATVDLTGGLGASTGDDTGVVGNARIGGDLTGRWDALRADRLKVAGNATGVVMALQQQVEDGTFAINKLDVKGWMTDCRLMAAGGLNMLSAGGMDNTDVYVGYLGGESDVTDLPTEAQAGDDTLFDPDAVANRIIVKGMRDGRDRLNSFIESNIAGGQLGNVKLYGGQGDEAFGLACDSLDKYQYQDEATRYRWKNAGDDELPDPMGNLIVRIV